MKIHGNSISIFWDKKSLRRRNGPLSYIVIALPGIVNKALKNDSWIARIDNYTCIFLSIYT